MSHVAYAEEPTPVEIEEDEGVIGSFSWKQVAVIVGCIVVGFVGLMFAVNWFRKRAARNRALSKHKEIKTATKEFYEGEEAKVKGQQQQILGMMNVPVAAVPVVGQAMPAGNMGMQQQAAMYQQQPQEAAFAQQQMPVNPYVQQMNPYAAPAGGNDFDDAEGYPAVAGMPAQTYGNPMMMAQQQQQPMGGANPYAQYQF